MKYGRAEIDFVIVYYQPTGSFYVIPYEDVEGKTAINLRLGKTGNNQRAGIIAADLYEDRWDLLRQAICPSGSQ